MQDQYHKILVMMIAVLAFITASAQPPFGPPPGHGGPGGQGGDRNARTIEMLQKSLNMTPEQAKIIGSDYIVVGRPITAAEDPVAAYERCIAEFVD